MGVEIIDRGRPPDRQHARAHAFRRLPRRAHAPAHLTYLMWRGDKGFRVGTTRTVRGQQRASDHGLQIRALQEHADAAWVCRRTTPRARRAPPRSCYVAQVRDPDAAVRRAPGRQHERPRSRPGADRQRLRRASTPTPAACGCCATCTSTSTPAPRPALVRGPPPQRRRSRSAATVGAAGPMHVVAIGGRDRGGARRLIAPGFSVRPAKRGSRAGATSPASSTTARRSRLVDRIRLAIPRRSRPVRRGSASRALALHARRRRFDRGWRCSPRTATFDLVESVERVPLDGPVYDLNVEDTHNFVAGGLVTHNSIYGFRGADIRNILDFEDDYPDAHVVKLEQNYRSTQTILDAANAVIANNRGQMAKHLWTDVGEGDPVRRARDGRRARRGAVGRRRRSSGSSTRASPRGDRRLLPDQRAVAGAGGHARAGRQIAYQVIGGTKFYERAEIKDAVSYLTFLVNPQDGDGVHADRELAAARDRADVAVARARATRRRWASTVWEAATRRRPRPGDARRARRSGASWRRWSACASASRAARRSRRCSRSC